MKRLPHSEEAERAVLGASMLTSRAVHRAMQITRPAHFYRDAHATIFRAIVSMVDRQIPIDIVTLGTELRRLGRLADVGGAHYLAELHRSAVTDERIEHHARIVYEQWLRRRIIEEAMAIASTSYDDGIDALGHLSDAQRAFFDLARQKPGKVYKTMPLLTTEAATMIRQAHASKGCAGLSTYLYALDRAIGGLHPTDLVIVAGRPGMGKSGLADTIAFNVARQGMSVGMFSMEMSGAQHVLRLVAGASGVNGASLRAGRATDEEVAAALAAADQMAAHPIIIDERPALSMMDLTSTARMMQVEHDIRLLIVDYLQLARGSRTHTSRHQETDEISKGLKRLAKELDIPVIALSQLNRSVESRGDKRPMLSDLRESGSIEEDADTVLLLYRPAYYEFEYHPIDNSPATIYDAANARIKVGSTVEIIIAKQRSGATGSVRLLFEDRYARFTNLEGILAIQQEMKHANNEPF